MMMPRKMAASARSAGLHYATDSKPGISRRRRGSGFVYLDAKGRFIRDRRLIGRIRHLAIPPAWRKVWICPSQTGHLQATGLDAKGRKQYRYHPDWRKVREETKYHSMIDFGRSLPRIRKRVQRDLALKGLPRQKVLAAVTRLLETTLVRVGNDEYARDNGSFGLTTLRNRHVGVHGEKLSFSFRGKSGKHHEMEVRSPKLAAIVKRCRELPGQELFAYLDETGRPVDVTSGDVNDYLYEISGKSFTAKDFRTWAGTVLAAQALKEFEKFETPAEAKRNMLDAIRRVAGRLGNTPAICRKCYIHPVIFETYLDGSLVTRLKRAIEHRLTSELKQLRPDEGAVLMLLQQTLKRPKS